MKYLLVRHAKTDGNRLTRAAFGKSGAPLNEIGKQQVAKFKDVLLSIGIDENQKVAISEFQRTTQTANLAGFNKTVIYPLLNEVKAVDPKSTNALILSGKLPSEAIESAKAILANPPAEKIWITHGLLIAAIEHVLGQSKTSGLIPDFCEIREVEI